MLFDHLKRAFAALLQQFDGPLVISIVAVCLIFAMVFALQNRHEAAWGNITHYIIYGAIILAIAGGALAAILA